MLLSNIIERPEASLIHMERYVNKGSPSGFTFKYSVSIDYDPRFGRKTFKLPYYIFSNEEVEIFGEGEEVRLSFDPMDTFPEKVSFPVHPDMVKVFLSNGLKEFVQTNISDYLEVVPLANARTVYTIGKTNPYYIKLHYEGCVGRILRGLPKRKAIAGPEISKELVFCVNQGLVPSTFAFLKEFQTRIKICSNENLQEVGVVFRETNPFPYQIHRALIPFFSLWSVDIKHPNDQLLLIQILDKTKYPIETFFNKIIKPILECYKFLTFDRGLIPEVNGQNILLEIDQNGIPTRIIHRDFQGYEKDITIRQSKGLSVKFESQPYKCIDKRSDTKYYYIRHSFSYDFKLGGYIFDELFDVVCKNYWHSRVHLENKIAELFHEITEGKDESHFKPLDKWYAHEKILLTDETQRSYIELDNPKYRRH